jgi:ankyrin repeat protein
LLAKGADIDRQSDNGQTALSIAEKDGNLEVIEALRRAQERSSTKPTVAAPAAEGKASGEALPSPAAPVPATEAGQFGAVVNIKTLNVREGPATHFAKLGALKQGEELDALGRLKDCSWLKVRSRTQPVAGWVSAEKGNLSLRNACEKIPEEAVQPR